MCPTTSRKSSPHKHKPPSIDPRTCFLNFPGRTDFIINGRNDTRCTPKGRDRCGKPDQYQRDPCPLQLNGKFPVDEAVIEGNDLLIITRLPRHALTWTVALPQGTTFLSVENFGTYCAWTV